ncbi:hypothetical protein MHU86_4246 [Fragilaria crotonensis]|nr:hypothetical protein MHU86_4246 [Fragilaria crotonensis]
MSEAEASLGKLAEETERCVRSAGWRCVVSDLRGHSNISAGVRNLPHKAARLLDHLRRRGAAVPMATLPWSDDTKRRAVVRGPHRSSDGEREFVAKEMLDFCRQGYWLVLPYSVVKDWPNLRISPLGVVPQRDRRPRLIVDYTFSGVNLATLQLAPREAMQFGRALQRVLSKIVHADPRFGPTYMAKIDIADGFYRHSPCMGWVESPAYFSTLTETSCDLANLMLATGDPRLRSTHRLEAVAATPPDDLETLSPVATPARATAGKISSKRPPLATVDVYVDDFLLLAQTQHQRTKVLRAALTSIDEVFRPLTECDPTTRKEPASIKKMLKGEACWSTKKRILGWDLDTEALTLTLPPHRLTRLREVLQWLQPPRKRLATSKWHRLLGELRSMSPALPGTRGLFSVLQHALSRGDQHRVRLTRHVYDTAADFTALVDSLAARPTRLPELVPTFPSHVGASDACQVGMGGVWFPTDTREAPLVWRSKFPTAVSNALITSDNPHGSISISDLELTGMIAQKDIVAHASDVRERTIWIAGDNRAAIAWSDKGSSTSVATRAYLLQYNALHQRHHRYLARHHYIPGPVNAMADAASRRWDLSDDAFLTHFNLSYPQATSWRLFPLSSATSSALTGALFKKRPHDGFPNNDAPPPPPPGLSVEDALRAVGQTYAGMGSPDPRLTPQGDVDFRIAALLRAWKKEDPPPLRVKPLPLTVVTQIWTLAHLDATLAARAAAECLVLGFFFLLRPGEYLGKPLHPTGGPLFRLRDIRLWIGSRALDTLHCSDADLLAATFVCLTFREQKNGVRNETIGHGRSGHAHLCPVHCIAVRVRALRHAGADLDTPLNAFRAHASGPFRYITSSDLTTRIRAAIMLHPDPAYTLSDVSVRSTRSGGAMALLCAGGRQ